MKNISFSSFEELYQSIKPISEIIDSASRYKAHRPAGDTGEKETLEEHINLVNHYALLMMREHNLEVVIDNIIYDLVANFKNKEQLGDWIKKFFLSAIV
ncbi:hypothetical protein RZS08_04315, partial [Arthrospira platensis SPKY1]|nr:hypothetical protein [Arthrospira platensis SPKY1]